LFCVLFVLCLVCFVRCLFCVLFVLHVVCFACCLFCVVGVTDSTRNVRNLHCHYISAHCYQYVR
jgi:hypothetical protein